MFFDRLINPCHSSPISSPQETKSPPPIKGEELLKGDSLSPFSLLQAYDPKMIEEMNVSIEALKSICLGSSSYKTRGGWHSKRAVPYFLKLFYLYAKEGGLLTKGCFPKELIAWVKQLEEFWKRFERGDRERHAEELGRSIANLSSGSSLIMGSGYAGDPTGHSMIIRFTKMEGGSYEIRVYDGADAGKWSKAKEHFHPSGHPYLQFEGVTREELFFASKGEPFNPIILYNLLKLLDSTNRGDYNFETVLSILAPFRHRLVPGCRLASLFIGQQRGDNCVSKTFNCFILDFLRNHRDIFKRIVLDNRFHTILFYFLLHQEELKVNLTASFELLQAIRNLSRSLKLHLKKGVIKEEEFAALIATLRDILNHIPVADSATPPSLDPIDENALKEKISNSRKEIIEAVKKFQEYILPSSSTQSENRTALHPIFELKAEWNSLGSLFEQLIKNNLHPSWTYQVEYVMENAQGLKHSRCELDPLQAKSALQVLRTAAFSYMNALFKENKMQSCASQNCCMEFLAIGYCLARASDVGNHILEGFGIYFDYFRRQDSHFLFAMQDPCQLEHRNDLIRFFSSLPPQWLLFNFETEWFKHDLFHEGKTAESKLIQDYFPNISQKDRLDLYLNPTKWETTDYSYIAQLNSLAGFATCFTKFRCPSAPLQSIPKRILYSNNQLVYGCGNNMWRHHLVDDGYEEEWGVIPQVEENNKGSFYEKPARKLSPFMASFFKYSLWKHQKKMIPTENQWQKASAEKDIFSSRELLSPLCEPSIQISTLFSRWSENIELLADPEWRSLFENMFFKTCGEYSFAKSPLFEAIKNDPFLPGRIAHLTSEGYRHIHHLPFKPEYLQSFLGFLAILRLRSSILYVRKICNRDDCRDEELFSQRSKSLNWLDQLIDSPLSQGYLKSEFLLAKVALLMEISLDAMNTKERAQLALAYCKLYPHLGQGQKGESTILRREVQRRWIKMTPEWIDFFLHHPKRGDFFSECFSQISGDSNQNGTVQVSGTRAEYGSLWFDFGEIEIGSSLGRWNDFPPDFLQTPVVKRLFSGRKHGLSTFGQNVAFNDPVWGKINIQVQTYEIVRIFQGRHYRHLSQYHFETLNAALRYDHAFWLCTDPQLPHCLICDLKTGKICYTIDEKGKVISPNTGKEYVPQGHAAFSIAHLVEKFEDPSHISCFLRPDHRWELEFARFKTSSGDVLSFTFDPVKKVWIYNDHPSYYIQTRFHRTWGFERCLHLSHVDGTKELALVPVGMITSSGYNPECRIELPPGNRDENKGGLHFFTYEVVGSELQARPINALLYLGSLALACKQCQKSLSIFKNISLSDTPDEQTWLLFQDLILSASERVDYSSNGMAVLLHLLHFFLILDPHNPHLEDQRLIPSLEEIFLYYYQSLNNVEKPLLLSFKQEEILLQFLIPKTEKNSFLLRNRFNEIKGYSHHTDEMESVPNHHEFLGICNGYFPRCITHILPEQTFRENIKALREDPDFESRYQMLYQYSSRDYRWKEMIYTLATQRRLSLSDQFLLFFAHIYEIKGLKAYVPPLEADDNSIRQWKEALKDSFHTSRSDRDCFDRCNPYAALEFKPPSQTMSKRTSSKANPFATDRPFFWTMANSQRPFSDLQSPIASRYLEPAVQVLEQNIKANLPPPSSDPVYGKCMESHRAIYLRDRAFAAEQMKHKRRLKNPEDVPQLKEYLENQIEDSLAQEARLEKEMISLANRQPFEKMELAHFAAKRMGHALKKWTLKEICKKAVYNEWKEVFKEMNPALSSEDAAQLKNKAIEYMTAQTDRIQMQKCLIAIASYSKKPEQIECDQIAYELAQIRTFKPEEDGFLLYLEYISRFRLRLQQTELILNVRHFLNQRGQGMAFQARPNSGKTLMISGMMEMASERGLIPCIMSHHSQVSSMKGIMLEYQKSHFDKDLLFISYQLKDLGEPKILALILNRFEEAKRKKWGIQMQSSFPQIVLLKFIIECLRLKRVENSKKRDHAEMLKQLAQILQIFEREIISFLDECDLILHLLTEIYIPLADEDPLNPQWVEMVGAIYEILIHPDIREKLKLHKDQQKEVMSSVIEEEVLPFAAEKLFKHPGFGMEGKTHLKGAFVRNLLGKIPFEDQALADQKAASQKYAQEKCENIEFLMLMEKWSTSQDRYEMESAESYGLACLMFREVLPIAFGKSYNRNYGPLNPQQPKGEIIPYQGPDSPAKTRLGNMFLSLALHIQASLGGGISKDEIQFLAEKMLIAAQNYAHKEKKGIAETLEAKQFFELTNIEIDEASIPEKLQKAHAYINDPEYPERCLKIRQEVASFHVRYFPEYVSCNPIHFIEHISKPVACSGTKWIRSSFHPKMGLMSPDLGAEGAILNAIEERDSTSPAIHVLPDQSLDSLLNLIRTHPFKGRVRCNIDGGGFIKACTRGGNREQTSRPGAVHPNVARILTFFENEPDTHIKAVLYMHRYSREEVEMGFPEEAYVIAKMGSVNPVRLENTTVEAIAKVGIPIENLFFLIDELNGAGFDAKMAPDTIFLVTIDLDSPMRTLIQNSQRAREFFKRQNLEYCLTQETIQTVLKGNKSMKAVDELLEANEAKMIADLTLRSYHLQFSNILHSYAIGQLREAALEGKQQEIESLSERFSDFLITRQSDKKLWARYGRVQKRVPIAEYFQNQEKETARTIRFKGLYLESKVQEVAERAKAEVMVPSTVEARALGNLDNQMELAREEEVKLDLDEDLTLTEEVSLVWDRYQISGGHSDCFDEVLWGLNLHQGILSLNNQMILSAYECCHEEYPLPNSKTLSTIEFAPCFDDLMVSINLKNTYTYKTPLFHRDAKTADFVLLLEENKKLFTILLSKKDAAFFKEWISDHNPTNVWLVNLDGVPEVESKQGVLLQKKKEDIPFHFMMQRGLWQANFYQGNIHYLEAHPDLSIQMIKGQKQLFGKYLTLKNRVHPKKLHATFRSHLVDTSELSRKGNECGLLFSWRRKYLKQTYIEYQSLTKEQVENIDPLLVCHLGPHQIPWLTTKEQVSNLSPHAVNSLSPGQSSLLSVDQLKYLLKPELIKQLPPHAVPHLGKEQFCHLAGREHIALIPDDLLEWIYPDQVKYLEPGKYKLLRNPDHIAQIPIEMIPHIAECQIPFLKEGQIRALPPSFVNFLEKKSVALLNQQQIQAITVPELIGAIPCDAISWTTPEQVFAFHAEQIQAIPANRPDLFERIPPHSLNHLQPIQLMFLSSRQIPLIENAALIRTFTPEMLLNLSAAQVPSLQRHQIKNLPGALVKHLQPQQIRYITQNQIPKIDHPDLIQALLPEQIPSITQAQVSLLSSGQVKDLPIWRPDLFKFIPLENVGFVMKRQVPYLNKGQIGALCDQLIGADEKEREPFIYLLNAISEKQFPWVTSEALPFITNKKLFFKKNPPK